MFQLRKRNSVGRAEADVGRSGPPHGAQREETARLPTSGFAILERCTATGQAHWVGIPKANCTSYAPASEPPSADQVYADKGAAERDAGILRAENLRLVLATAGRRNRSVEPRTYSVVPIWPSLWTSFNALRGSA
jgi:hypothetical protein